MGDGDLVDVRVLGPPALARHGGPAVAVRGPRQVATLALLVARRGRLVRREAIEDELWPDGPVSDAAVRVAIGRLRQVFVDATGVDPIVSDGGSYGLDPTVIDVDADRFTTHAVEAAAAAERGRPREVEELARAALGLWRGEAFQGVSDLASVAADRVRLEELRRDGQELLGEALLVLGRPAEARDVLAVLTDDDPFREAPWQLVLAALHATGKSVEALRAYDALAALLDRELGIRPDGEVGRVRDAIADRRPADEVVALAARRLSPEATPILAARPPQGRPPMAGRKEEVALIEDLVAGAGPRILVIEGSAGLGKTRLAEASVDVARAGEIGAVVATCPRPGATGQLVVRQMVTGLRDHLDPSVGPGPSAEDLLGASTVGSDAAAERSRVFSAIEQLLTSVGPALVVLDDVQWIDPSVAPLVAHLASVAPAARWLVLTRTGDRAAAATELLGDLTRRGATWHALAPLDGEEAGALVRQVAPGLGPDEVERAVALGAGSPLLLGELGRHLAAGGDPDAVPAAVDAVVAAEVSRLGPEVEAVAAALAVAGTPHPLRVVTGAAGLGGAAATRSVAALVAASLAATDGRRAAVWPAHDLVRDALLARLADHEVQDLHGRLARELLASGGDPRLALGHMLDDDGSDLDELEAVAARALDDPALFGAPHAVAALGDRLVRRAGETGTTSEAVATRLRVASARFGAGDTSGAQRLAASQAAAVARLGDPVLEALWLITRSSIASFGEATVEELVAAEEVLARLPEDEAPLRLSLACWIALASAPSRSTADARRMADVAASILDGAPRAIAEDPIERAKVATTRMAISLGDVTRPGETDHLIEEIVRCAAATSDPTTVATARLALLEQAMRTGTVRDVEAALVSVDELDTPVQRVEMRWFVAASHAAADIMRGDLVAAERSLTGALALGAAHGIGPSLGAMLLHRFVVEWELGRFGSYHALLPPLTDETDGPVALAHVFACIGAGDERGARAAADHSAHPGLLAVSGPGQWGVLAAMGGHAAWEARHAALGAVVADGLVGRPDEGLTAVGLCYLGPVSLARGLALAAAGDVDGALDQLEVAVARERGVGAPLTLARAAGVAAELRTTRGRSGDRAEARRLDALAAEARASTIRPAPGSV